MPVYLPALGGSTREPPSMPKSARWNCVESLTGAGVRQNDHMEQAETNALIAAAIDTLTGSGALFGYLHGSCATGTQRAHSDVDIAAYFGTDPPQAYTVLLPPGVDLLVLDHAPLELAGRIAVVGTLLFERDPVARVRWESTTRKIYFDELPRIRRAHAEFAAHVLGR